MRCETKETETNIMKKLLLSTALVAATSMPVFAQDAGDAFRTEADPQELHASEFIGMRVYRTDNVDAEAYEGVQDGWDDIGEINDVILSRDGNVEAVLVDIGGFLGIGENRVAVDMDSIRFVADSATPDHEDDFFLVLNVPRGALEEAPVYGMGHDETAAEMEETAAVENAEQEIEENVADAGQAAENALEETAEAADAVTTEETDMAASDETVVTPATPEAGTSETAMADDGTGLAREGYVTAASDDLQAEELTGASAYDINDKHIGEVSDLLLTDDGKIEAAVVDVGGFLGIGEKPVQLEMSKLNILRAEDGEDVRVYISMSEEELEALPEYEN